jgi:hypothetical protein
MLCSYVDSLRKPELKKTFGQVPSIANWQTVTQPLSDIFYNLGLTFPQFRLLDIEVSGT